MLLQTAEKARETASKAWDDALLPRTASLLCMLAISDNGLQVKQGHVHQQEPDSLPW